MVYQHQPPFKFHGLLHFIWFFYCLTSMVYHNHQYFIFYNLLAMYQIIFTATAWFFKIMPMFLSGLAKTRAFVEKPNLCRFLWASAWIHLNYNDKNVLFSILIIKHLIIALFNHIWVQHFWKTGKGGTCSDYLFKTTWFF